MAECRYTKDHEWISIDGEIGTIGITAFAQEQLGDVVFVELPEVGRRLTKGDEAAVVESVKAAAEVYAPVSGEVVAVNAALPDAPGLVNSAPEGDGWFMRVRLAKPDELAGLMDRAAYERLLKEQG